jgi:hypothetical protein
LAAFPLLALAQINPLDANVEGGVTAARGKSATAVVRVDVREGYHINSDKPADEYLIPLRLSWESSPLAVEEVIYPKPSLESYSFSRTPLSVLTGDFEIRTRFRVATGAPTGSRTVTGKLRYQACTDKLCLPPKTVEVRLPVRID